MFVENYRLDTMIGGQAQTVIPYPRISDEDWSKWKAFLPVKSVSLSKKILLNDSMVLLRRTFGIPSDACQEMVRGANYFEAIEVWRFDHGFAVATEVGAEIVGHYMEDVQFRRTGRCGRKPGM